MTPARLLLLQRRPVTQLRATMIIGWEQEVPILMRTCVCVLVYECVCTWVVVGVCLPAYLRVYVCVCVCREEGGCVWSPSLVVSFQANHAPTATTSGCSLTAPTCPGSKTAHCNSKGISAIILSPGCPDFFNLCTFQND